MLNIRYSISTQMWKRVCDLSQIKGLYYSVTPILDKNESLLKRFSDQYRIFCYYSNIEARKVRPLAFVVICNLPINKVIMINFFAVEDRIKKKGYSRQIFWTLIVQLPYLWPEIESYYNKWIIESYIHDIDIWCKIMKTKPVDTNIKPMYLSHNQIRLLQHDVSNAEDAYKEWQDFQSHLYSSDKDISDKKLKISSEIKVYAKL